MSALDAYLALSREHDIKQLEIGALMRKKEKLQDELKTISQKMQDARKRADQEMDRA